MTFDEAFDRLIGHEGGYVNHPDDPGGATNWGITERVARAHGYRGDMRDLPRDTAKQIYLADYWKGVKADQYDGAIGFQVFDAAVNHGVRQACKFLQRAVGVNDDGAIGPVSLAAINGTPISKVIACFNAERLTFYTDLKTWGTFGRGWARRIVGNLKYMAQDT